MLKDRQLSICNKVLKYIHESEKEVSYRELNTHLRHGGFNQGEINASVSFLENHYNLIESYTKTFAIEQYICYRLTPEGNEVIKTGIEKYIKRKNKNYNKIAVIISIIALCLSAIDPALKLKDSISPKDEIKKGDGNSEYRNGNADSIIKHIITNEAFIIKLKDSIKHDSVSLNELKIELKGKETS